MEANGSSSNSTESQPSGGSNNSSTEKPNEKEIFVNHGMSIKGKLVFVIDLIKFFLQGQYYHLPVYHLNNYFGMWSN